MPVSSASKNFRIFVAALSAQYSSTAVGIGKFRKRIEWCSLVGSDHCMLLREKQESCALIEDPAELAGSNATGVLEAQFRWLQFLSFRSCTFHLLLSIKIKTKLNRTRKRIFIYKLQDHP
jgi:hypothetical protein